MCRLAFSRLGIKVNTRETKINIRETFFASALERLIRHIPPAGSTRERSLSLLGGGGGEGALI